MNPVIVEGLAELVSAADELLAVLDVENTKFGTNHGLDMLDPASNFAFQVRLR